MVHKIYKVVELNLDTKKFREAYQTDSDKCAFEIRDFLRWQAREWDISCVYGIMSTVVGKEN